MDSVIVTWDLPTKRDSGRLLPVEQINHVTIEISADQGANFSAYGDYTPDVLSETVPDLEIGVWFFRGTVFDTSGQASTPVVASIEILDTSPPGPLTLHLDLASQVGP